MSTEYGEVVESDVLTCESCPTQWEGQLRDGRYFYFRYRFGKASLAVGATAEEVSGRQGIAENVGDDLNGDMDLDEYRASFLRLYRRLAEDDGPTLLDFVIDRPVADDKRVVQEALPVAFLPDRSVTAAATALCGEICGSGFGHCEGCRDLALTALVAGLTAVDPLVDPHHVVIVGEDRWSLQHPLACRPNLGDCPMHVEVADAFGDNPRPLDIGRYRVEVRDGELLVDGAPIYDDPEDEDDQR
jgi:hypothetical protein